MPWTECFNPFKRAWLRVLLGVGVASLAALAASCGMPQLTRVAPDQFPRPSACAECHVEIHDEWARSPHADAFVNTRFVEATDGHRFGDCMGCHAPEPTLVTGPPAARRAGRELGVVCAACHLEHGAMVGPLPPTGVAKPHPIRVDPAPFAEGRLCGHCHQGELAQWRQASIENKPDCRECHMPRVIRKMTQATGIISRPLVAMEEPATEHRHLFLLTPTELPFAPFTLDVAPAGSAATVTLHNRLPHNLPTGDYGVRVVQVKVSGLDAVGRASDLAVWELTNFGREPLASGQSRQWRLEVPRGTVSLALEVARHGRDGADRVVLLRKEVRLP